jgi:hypothetical protein
MEWFKNLGTPQGMADLAAELDAGYVAGMCLVCKSKVGLPHNQAKHDFYESTVSTLKKGIIFGFTDGTEETVVLCEDGVLRSKDTPWTP